MPPSATADPSTLRFDAVVFDLDGTLVDSREDLTAGVNAMRAELGLGPLPVARVVEMIGKGSRHLVRRALPAECSGDGFERAYQRLLDLYYDCCVDATRPYDGVEEMLEAIAALPGLAGAGGAAGPALAVVTNKPARHTEKVLGGLGLDRRFRFFLGGDSLSRKKPDPEPLLEAARRLEVPVERLLFVGDSETDGETARRAGAPVALVGWGFGGAEELAPFDAIARPARPAELAAFVWERCRAGS